MKKRKFQKYSSVATEPAITEPWSQKTNSHYPSSYISYNIGWVNIRSVLSWLSVAMFSNPTCLSCVGILRKKQLLMSGRLTKMADKGLTMYIRPVLPWLSVAMFSTLGCLSCIGILKLRRSQVLTSGTEPD